MSLLLNQITFYLSDSGASNSLLVEEWGEGGLDTLVSEFHAGRYQYGLVGVNITNRGTRVRREASHSYSINLFQSQIAF